MNIIDSLSVRQMKETDYEEVYALWKSIKGFAIRSIDDSYEGVLKFIRRNPSTSVVALLDGKIVGTILCGQDGRQGYLYHVCVHKNHRKQGIGRAMVVAVMRALQDEGINKIALIAFTTNEVGNIFWDKLRWRKRSDVNYYDYVVNEENIIAFNQYDESI